MKLSTDAYAGVVICFGTAVCLCLLAGSCVAAQVVASQFVPEQHGGAYVGWLGLFFFGFTAAWLGLLLGVHHWRIRPPRVKPPKPTKREKPCRKKRVVEKY